MSNTNVEKIYQDTDSTIIYSGEWWNSSGRTWSDDGSSFVSGNTGDSVSFTFTGDAISFWGESCNDQGEIDIYIDDIFHSTINTYSIERQYSHLQFISEKLSSNEQHTFKGIVKGNGLVLLDCLKVYTATNLTAGIASANKYQYSGSVTINFNQSIDANDATSVNNYSFNNNIEVVAVNLNPDNTSVQLDLNISENINDFILTLGQIHSESRLNSINGYTVSGTFLEAEIIINDNSSDIVYEGDWMYSSSRDGFSVYGNDCHAATGTDSSASLTFVGTAISYIAETDADQGDVEIYIDDISQGLFSTYTPERAKSHELFIKDDLVYGQHTIKIVKRSGTWILLDALKVYNDAPLSLMNTTNAPGKCFVFNFNQTLDVETATDISNYSINNGGVIESITLNDQKNSIIVKTNNVVYPNKYTISFSNIFNEFKTQSVNFGVPVSRLSTDDLLTLVQKHTFKNFWDYAHPESGLTYEWVQVDSETSTDTATTIGGSGFGVMAILVGIERGFISRSEGLERINTIVDFLGNKAQRYKGAWSHWVNSNTGQTIPFTPPDNGGDIVETSYMVQGLLTARQYFNDQSLTDKINELWHTIEWDYFTNNSPVLYWHIDKDYKFTIGMTIIGWNEPMITYMLAIASPTYAIDPSLWQSGWSQGTYNNKNQVHYGITLPIGPDFGGPMFFMHYSFLGFDPRNILDSANNVNYFNQGVSQSQIQQAYSTDNPNKFVGYSDACWGLTSGNQPNGYDAHQPTNDNGTITVTAALSDFPYLPEASIKALRYFYDEVGESLWNDKCGFVDGFNLTHDWFDSMYLAIDQGPIIVMIENYRSQLLWKYFMTCPEVQNSLALIGFKPDDYPGK